MHKAILNPLQFPRCNTWLLHLSRLRAWSGPVFPGNIHISINPQLNAFFSRVFLTVPDPEVTASTSLACWLAPVQPFILPQQLKPFSLSFFFFFLPVEFLYLIKLAIMTASFFPALLRYNWRIIPWKFKVYNVMVWYTYVLWNVYHNKIS